MGNLVRGAVTALATTVALAGPSGCAQERGDVRVVLTSEQTAGTEFGRRLIGMGAIVTARCQTEPSPLNNNVRLFIGELESDNESVPAGTTLTGLRADGARPVDENDADEFANLPNC